MLLLSIRPDPAGFDRTIARFKTLPEKLKQAQVRAQARLRLWVYGRVLAELAVGTQVPAQVWRTRKRLSLRQMPNGLEVWVGSMPVYLHLLGPVHWSRAAPGATVAGKVYPGTWSWPHSRRYAGMVMQRLSRRREDIAPVTLEVHRSVIDIMRRLAPEIATQYRSYLMLEMRAALGV